VKVYICGVNPLARITILLISLFVAPDQLFAQMPTNQDCPNAIPICNTTYSTVISYSGTGNIPNEINNGSSCLLSGERNDVWYTFTTPFFGNLNFTITPNNPSDDYDWAVYNLTNATCADIFNNPAIEVSCNYAPNLGCGGTTGPNNNTAGPCGGQNNPVIPVTPGQTYVINVSNFSSTQSGYTIDFTASTGSIFDVFPPYLLSSSSLTCGSSSITLTFNENVTCSSVQPSDFVLTGPGGPYTITGVTSAGCATGAVYSKVYTVSFSPAIAVAGIYNFAIVNPVQDLCGNNLVVPTNRSINIIGATVTAQHTNVTCNGDDDGTITLTPGGIGPFTYQWSPNVSSSNTALNIPAGVYTVTVTPSNGACSALATITVTEPPDLVLQSQTITDATCGTATGAIAISISGGTSPYQYQWSPSGGSAATATTLLAGNYTLTVIDANNCDFTQTFSVADNNSINAAVNSIQNVSCKNGSNGAIMLAVSGVSSNVTYQWSNGATTKDLTNVPAGSYSVTITDGNCSTQLSNLTIIEPLSVLTASPMVTATQCGLNNGMIAVNASGGTGTLSYQWSPNGSGASSSALASGNYTITITDANGCTAIRTVNIAASSSPVAAVNYIQQTVSCYNGTNGGASISVSNGTAPYQYQWSGGMGTTATNNTLSPGNYSVTITDQSGCTTLASVTINNAPPLVLTAGAVQHVKCFGQNTGSATYVGSGGTGSLNYQWSPSGGNSATANNLYAGTYTVLLTDGNGCTANATVIIQQPAAALSNSVQSASTSCGLNNGSSSCITSGGTAPYTYQWSNGNTSNNQTGLTSGLYTVTVTDAQQCTTSQSTVIATSSSPTIATVSIQQPPCNGQATGSITLTATSGLPPYSYQWSNGSSNSNTLNNLGTGNYTVTITDQAGCSISAVNTITAPSAINIQLVSQQNIKCYGNNSGELEITSSGGTGNLNYLWSNGTTANVISNLTAGNYTVTVTDQNGCTVQQTYSISQPASPLNASATPTATSCGLNNGSATVVVSGGTSPYKYLWSTGSNSSQINNLTSGTYTVTVSDFYNCSLSRSTQIQPSTAVTVQQTQQINVLCHGGNNGATLIIATGGIAPYTYLWNTGQSNSSLQNLNAGTYLVTVTDQAGCTTGASFTITEPTALIPNSIPLQQVCSGQNTVLVASASGGIPPYLYHWSNGSLYDTLWVSPTANTSYSVTITDQNGCTANTNASINVFPPLTIDPFNAYSVCENTALNFTAHVSGGNGVYSYNWNNGASQQATFNNIFSSTTSVLLTVTDGCNYMASSTIQVNVVPNPIVQFTVENNIGCIPLTIHLKNNSQAVAGSVYEWNTGTSALLQNTGDTTFTYDEAGQFYPSLTITTPAPELCQSTLTYADGVTALALPLAEFSFDPESPTILNPEISFKNISQYATVYNWSFGDGAQSNESNPNHTYTTIGSFEVVLTASNSFCDDTAKKVIELTDQFSFYIPNSFTPNDDGRNDVFEVYGTNIISARMAIYSRWGEKVFESSSWPIKWNGKKINSGVDLPQGIYVYAVEITDKFGNNHSYSGTISIIK
jgi:gliding motility-associated-like protein